MYMPKAPPSSCAIHKPQSCVLIRSYPAGAALGKGTMYTEPVALATGVQTEVTVFSIRLAQWFARGARPEPEETESARDSIHNADHHAAVSFLLLDNGTVVFQSSCMPDGRAVF